MTKLRRQTKVVIATWLGRTPYWVWRLYPLRLKQFVFWWGEWE